MSFRFVRRLFQLAVVIAAGMTGIAVAAGWWRGSVEKFCPFGGLETLHSVLTARRMSCAAGELNLALFAALVVLTLVARKSFCAWVCPVGTVAEGLAALGRKIRRLRSAPVAGGRRPGLITPSRRVDGPARWLRFVVLGLVLYFTAQTGELIFRPYDPYYVLFSVNGHDVEPWSYGLLALLLAAAVVLPMAWCRYLCPLGGALWPLSAVSRLRLRRETGVCTGCGACEAVCPHSLRVATVREVRSAECTLCLECVAACPTPGALELRATGRVRSASGRRSLSVWLVPTLVAAAAALGVAGAELVRIPSYTREIAASAPEGAREEAVFVVDGLRCVDTARTLSDQLTDVPGVLSFTAYAARHEAHVVFDPRHTDRAAIRRAIEGPVYDAASGAFLFHVFRVVEDDGPSDRDEGESR